VEWSIATNIVVLARRVRFGVSGRMSRYQLKIDDTLFQVGALQSHGGCEMGL